MSIIPESFYASKEAERALLGAILIESSNTSTDAITAVRRIILPTDFTDTGFPDNLHEHIYIAMLTCESSPHQINVARKLFQSNQLRIGDIPYLCHLVADCPNCFDYLDYAKAVKTYALARGGRKQPMVRGFQE